MTLTKSPRWLLWLLGVGHLVVGHLTFSYPAGFFADGWAWGSLAAAAGLACLVAPFGRRPAVLAGGLVVGHAAGKGLAYAVEALGSMSPVPQLSMFAGSAVYAMLAGTSWVAWRRVVVPWSAMVNGGRAAERGG